MQAPGLEEGACGLPENADGGLVGVGVGDPESLYMTGEWGSAQGVGDGYGVVIAECIRGGLQGRTEVGHPDPDQRDAISSDDEILVITPRHDEHQVR